jgi:DNA-binding CsgD family transcriptional regulator
VPPFNAMNSKQKECLRLVSEGLTSKQIAPKVGLTHESVNTYVKSATRLLGAPNRSVAARMLLDYEALPKWEFPPDPVEAADQIGQIDGADELPRFPSPIPFLRGGIALVPPIGGRISNLTAIEKIVAMLRAAIFMAAIIATLVLLIAGGLKLL